MLDNDVWLTQKAIARLFDVDRSVVTKHLTIIRNTRRSEGILLMNVIKGLK